MKSTKFRKPMKKAALASAITAFIAGTADAGTYSTRIIGGADAPANTYPWMVSVQSKDGNEHFCGGSLIADKYVMTAAHCLEETEADEIQVVVSEFDLDSQSNQEEKISVKHVYVHEEYGDDNDIALLELSSPSSKTPVKLADAQLNDGLAIGANMTVMGWGNTSSDGESFPNLLQEVQVPLADAEQCKTTYSEVGVDITNNMLCAGLPEGGKDSCQGDSGGPLVYQKDSDWIQTGIVSFGEGCAEENFFGVYTKVSAFEEWIAKAKSGQIEPYEPEDDEDWEDEDWDEDEWDEEYDEYDEYDDEWDDEYDDDELEELPFGLPAYLEFVATDDEETVEESFEFVNETDSPITIQSITIDNEQHFTLLEDNCAGMTLNPDEECEIEVAYTAGEEDLSEALLTISTSDSENPTIEIPLVGEQFDEMDLDDEFDGMDGIEDEEWFFDGDDAWEGDSEEGEFSLSPDAVNVNEEAVLMTELEGPGILEFEMTLEGDAAGNTLSFMVDGEVVTTLSSQRSNRGHSVELSEGEHQVAWVYRKTETSEAGAEASVSDIEFEREDDYEDDFSDDEGFSQDELGDAAETLVDAASGAGSADSLLITILSLLGLGSLIRNRSGRGNARSSKSHQTK